MHIQICGTIYLMSIGVSPSKCVIVPQLHDQYSLFQHWNFVSAGDTD